MSSLWIKAKMIQNFTPSLLHIRAVEPVRTVERFTRIQRLFPAARKNKLIFGLVSVQNFLLIANMNKLFKFFSLEIIFIE